MSIKGQMTPLPYENIGKETCNGVIGCLGESISCTGDRIIHWICSFALLEYIDVVLCNAEAAEIVLLSNYDVMNLENLPLCDDSTSGPPSSKSLLDFIQITDKVRQFFMCT